MLETIEFGEDRNEILDTLIFSVSCPIARRDETQAYFLKWAQQRKDSLHLCCINMKIWAHGEMLETIEFGEDRNELLDTLIFSVSCPIGNLEDILIEGCQELFMYNV
mgnify:CR=1 FL=1